MTHVSELSDDELHQAMQEAQRAYLQVYLESKHDVPELLELIAQLEARKRELLEGDRLQNFNLPEGVRSVFVFPERKPPTQP